MWDGRIIHLTRGRGNGGDRACVMTGAAYLDGQENTDHPDDMCPVFSQFLRSANDIIDSDDQRSRLLSEWCWLIRGTKGGAGDEMRRVYLLADMAVRTAAPAGLRRAGMHADAEVLEALAPITNTPSARAAVRAAARAARYCDDNAAASAAAACAACAADAAAESANAAAASAACADDADDAAADAANCVTHAASCAASACARAASDEEDDMYMVFFDAMKKELSDSGHLPVEPKRSWDELINMTRVH